MKLLTSIKYQGEIIPAGEELPKGLDASTLPEGTVEVSKKTKVAVSGGKENLKNQAGKEVEGDEEVPGKTEFVLNSKTNKPVIIEEMKRRGMEVDESLTREKLQEQLQAEIDKE